MKRQCEICGGTFTTYPSRVKIEHGRTCSRQCQAKWQSIHRKGEVRIPKRKVRCEICGKVFDVKSSRADTARFCSWKCKVKGHSKDMGGAQHPAWTGNTRICEHCGKEFHVKPSAEKNGDGKYCSMACYNASKPERWMGESNPRWRGGHDRYRGRNWQRQRRRARRRDAYTCQSCGVKESDYGRQLDVHHMVPFADFADYRKANELANLMCLCRECHARHEVEDGWPPLFVPEPEQAALWTT